MSRRCVASTAVPTLLLFLGGVAAQAAELTFSPSPIVAGQPFTATFQSQVFSCGDEGLLEVRSIDFTAKTVDLEVAPPNCPIIPIGYVDYTASATVGALTPGSWRVTVFQEGTSTLLDQEVVEVRQEPVCEVTETSLCLDDHFEVTGEWTDFQNHHGVAHAVPDDFQGVGNYGVFWFFSPDNPEMVVKVLNGCSSNSRYWVFLSPASTVEYSITVRDVRTGQQKTYSNALGQVPSLTADTSAFPCSN